MKHILTTVVRLLHAEVWVSRPVLCKLLKWTVVVILVLTIGVVALYVSASNRNASDDSLIRIIQLCLILSLLLVISSIYGIILDLIYCIKSRQLVYLAGIIGYILLMIVGIILVLGSAFIIVAVGGNR